MVEPLRHRQTKGGGNGYVLPKATATQGGALVSKSCPTVARGDLRLQMCTSSVEDGDVNLAIARPASPDMLREDADQPARCRQSFVEEIRGNSLNRIPQVQKLRFSLSGHRTSDTSELVHRSAADLALDDRDYGPVNHRKFEGLDACFRDRARKGACAD